MYSYDFFNRSSSNTDANGEPAADRPDADDEDLQATLQHVVVTYDPVNGRRIYVNGEFTGDVDAGGGRHARRLGRHLRVRARQRGLRQPPVQGVFRLVAIHNRALTPAQIQQNFAGRRRREVLPAVQRVSHLVNVPQSYIMFEVSQYDSYGYLFNKPTFISLDAERDARRQHSAPGMRIGVNGIERRWGRRIARSTPRSAIRNYRPATGQPLASIGTVDGAREGPGRMTVLPDFDVLGTTPTCGPTRRR